MAPRQPRQEGAAAYQEAFPIDTPQKASLQCLVCRHLEKSRIELLVAGGASHRSVADKFGLSRYSVDRHWKHIPEERKIALALGPVTQAALAARVSEESGSVLDGFKASLAGLWHLYDVAITAGDRTGGALLSGRIHENLNSVARLTGQIMASPMIQNNTVINNNMSLRQTAEYIQLKADLNRVLSRHPEALRDVIAEFDRLDNEALPALEHNQEYQHADAAAR
jgi:hypothetical protein